MAGQDVAAAEVTKQDEPLPETAPRSSSYEYRSRLKIGALPLVHIVRGVDPSTGTRPPAIGVIAVGQVAIGVIAVGQLAVGGIAVGQAALGLGWGIGQLAVGLLAAGQVAAGALGSVGQVALGPQALGLIVDHSAWAALAWLLGGLTLLAWVMRRIAAVGPIVGKGTGDLAQIASLRDGRARVAARVISMNHLQAPLSNHPCVYWHSLRVGPGIRAQEKAGTDVLVADGSGTARVDLSSAVMFIHNERYTELPAPDWSLYMETVLAQGDHLYVAGPVRLEPDDQGQTLYRPGTVAPVFRGDAQQPVVITTQPPRQLGAELKLGFAMAVSLLAAALLSVVF